MYATHTYAFIKNCYITLDIIHTRTYRHFGQNCWLNSLVVWSSLKVGHIFVAYHLKLLQNKKHIAVAQNVLQRGEKVAFTDSDHPQTEMHFPYPFIPSPTHRTGLLYPVMAWDGLHSQSVYQHIGTSTTIWTPPLICNYWIFNNIYSLTVSSASLLSTSYVLAFIHLFYS